MHDNDNACRVSPATHSSLGNLLVQGPAFLAASLMRGHGLPAPVLLRNPLLLLAGGVAGGLAAGYLLHKYEKEIILALSKASGMGRDFVLHQRETLEDLLAEAHAAEQQTGTAETGPAATPPASAQS